MKNVLSISFFRRLLHLFLLTAGFLSLVHQRAEAYWVTDLEVTSMESGAVVSIHTDAPVSYQFFTLGEPSARLVVDFSDATHHLPKYNFSDLGTPLISEIRTSQYRPFPQPSVRIVLDMPSLLPFQIESKGNAVVILLNGSSEELAEVKMPIPGPLDLAAEADRTSSQMHDQTERKPGGLPIHSGNLNSPEKAESNPARWEGLIGSGLFAGGSEDLGADKPTYVEENQLFEGIIEPIIVTPDSSDAKMTLAQQIDRHMLRRDPSCFNHDIFMHLQRSPLISSGLFSSRISVNGNRPEDTQIEIDRILRVYDWGKIQNVFGIFDPGIFATKLNRFGYSAQGEGGFSRIELSTNPRRKSSVALRFFDFSASANCSPFGSELFTMANISWLDQIINRLLGKGFVCPNNQEFYSKATFGPNKFRVNSNFWWFREGSFIKTGAVTDTQAKKSYQTEADWRNEKELMAYWTNTGVIMSSQLFLELAFSIYDAHRFDEARGESGMVGIGDPTNLFVDLNFSTRTVSSMAELSYFARHFQMSSGTRVSRIQNRLRFQSDGYYYPGFYRSQRGDEISPEELKNGSTQEDAFETSYWTHVKMELLGFRILAGLVGSYRTDYAFGLSPRIQIGHPLSLPFFDGSRLIVSLGKYRQFPGAERVYITMYPLNEPNGKVEESYLLTLGFRSDQMSLSLTASRVRNLYTPGYENSRFTSTHADGYTAGFEMGFKKRLGDLSARIDYGYGLSINSQEGVEYPSVYDPGHNVLLSFFYEPGERFSLTTTLNFEQGQRINRLIGREETPQGYVPIWDPIPNSARLPARLTISLGGTLFLTEKVLISLYAVNVPGYRCAVFYEGWDSSKKSYVKYPFVIGMGTELNF